MIEAPDNSSKELESSGHVDPFFLAETLGVDSLSEDSNGMEISMK